MSYKPNRSKADYLDFPKARAERDYNVIDTKYKQSHSKGRFDSPQRSSKDTPKQTPKSILKESNGFSANKKKRNIIINEDQNKTHNISQPSETNNSFFDKDSSFSHIDNDVKKRLHSDSSASDLSRRSYDRSMNKYDPVSSDDSFQDRLQVKATSLNEFYKPNYQNRSIEFDLKNEAQNKRSDITDNQMANVRRAQNDREAQLAAKYRTLTSKVQASIAGGDELSSERNSRLDRSLLKSDFDNKPSKVLTAHVEDKYKTTITTKSTSGSGAKESRKLDDSKLKSSFTSFDNKGKISLMPRSYPITTSNADSAKVETKFRSSFQAESKVDNSSFKPNNTFTSSFGAHAGGNDRIKTIDDKFKGIESKISAIEKDITQYQQKLRSEAEKDKRIQQEFGKEYDKIDSKVKGIKTELNKSFEKSRVETHEKKDILDFEPSSTTGFSYSKKLSSDTFNDHHGRSSSFSRNSLTASDKEDTRISLSAVKRKKSSSGVDLKTELERLREENEYLRSQLGKSTTKGLPARLSVERKKTPVRDRSAEPIIKKKSSHPKATSSLANVSREQELLDAIERIKDKLKNTIKKPFPFEDNYSFTKGKMNATFHGTGNFSGSSYLDGLKKKTYGNY